MEAFTVVRGPAAPLIVPDINTDVISPAHGRKGDLAADAFAPLRYLPDGTENPDFVLNREPFRGAPILLAAQNFGCGSSRETAVWSLRGLGIRCVIAESYSDIFFGNCFQNGVLPIVLGHDVVTRLAHEAASGEPVEVDLRTTTITTASGRSITFEVNPTRRQQLLDGLDDLDVGLRRRERIRAFQDSDRERRPWVYFAHHGEGAAATGQPRPPVPARLRGGWATRPPVI
jgi:3-isopropylmalate/(R)-2-methylmalate dehydratase small subunit